MVKTSLLLHPITHINDTFAGSQNNWATLKKKDYAIYMAFKNVSYYLYDAQISIKCDHAPLFFMAQTLNSKVNTWRTEITCMSYVKLEQIKGTVNILARHISRLMSMGLYDPHIAEEHS